MGTKVLKIVRMEGGKDALKVVFICFQRDEINSYLMIEMLKTR